MAKLKRQRSGTLPAVVLFGPVVLSSTNGLQHTPTRPILFLFLFLFLSPTAAQKEERRAKQPPTADQIICQRPKNPPTLTAHPGSPLQKEKKKPKKKRHSLDDRTDPSQNPIHRLQDVSQAAREAFRTILRVDDGDDVSSVVVAGGGGGGGSRGGSERVDDVHGTEDDCSAVPGSHNHQKIETGPNELGENGTSYRIIAKSNELGGEKQEKRWAQLGLD
jgi:hypothetical protein